VTKDSDEIRQGVIIQMTCQYYEAIVHFSLLSYVPVMPFRTRNIGERYKAVRLGRSLRPASQDPNQEFRESGTLASTILSGSCQTKASTRCALPISGRRRTLLVKSRGSNPISCSSRREAYDKWLQIATKTISF